MPYCFDFCLNLGPYVLRFQALWLLFKTAENGKSQERVLSGPHAQHWFSAQGLKVKDAKEVFRLLDADGSNGLSVLDVDVLLGLKDFYSFAW